MRKKLNENPVVQIALIGVLVVVVGVIFLMRMGSGAEEVPADTDPAAAVPATDPVTGAPTDPVAPAPTDAAPAPDASQNSVPPAGTPVDPTAFVAGPGLPKPLVRAYDDGKTVVLLVARQGGIDDTRVKDAVKSLRSSSEVAVFISATKHVARYSRIAQGVDLDRPTALIVLSPKNVSKGAMPAATVAYGYRSLQSVEQTIRDAGYEGPKLPYHPK